MAYSDFMGELREEIAKRGGRKAEEDKKKQEEENEEENKQEEKKNPGLGLPGKTKRWGNGLAKIEKVRMLNTAGEERIVFSTNEPVTVEMEYHVEEPVQDAVFDLAFSGQTACSAMVPTLVSTNTKFLI